MRTYLSMWPCRKSCYLPTWHTSRLWSRRKCWRLRLLSHLKSFKGDSRSLKPATASGCIKREMLDTNQIIVHIDLTHINIVKPQMSGDGSGSWASPDIYMFTIYFMHRFRYWLHKTLMWSWWQTLSKVVQPALWIISILDKTDIYSTNRTSCCN